MNMICGFYISEPTDGILKTLENCQSQRKTDPRFRWAITSFFSENLVKSSL